MKVTRSGLSLITCVAIISVAGTRARSRNPSEQQLTFVQLTDAHLFEERSKQPLVETYRLAADNWNALHWSISRINALVRAGKQIDFVVYTGDLGLQNVAFPDGKPCAVKAVEDREGLPPTPAESAANELIREFDRLNVRNIFFGPGSHDSQEGDGSDGRFDCFLLALQERAQALYRPIRIQKLVPDHCFALKGFHLLGLDSANFRKVARYPGVCMSRAPTEPMPQAVDGSCPQNEVGLLREQVSSGEPTLLFTHVPDLKDPLRQKPAWELDGRVRREWEREARRPNVLGIFAGHFHDPDRGLYGTPAAVKDLALDSQIGAKTYLAPPLAPDKRGGMPETGRGFLLVTANRTGIRSTEVQWFGSFR